MEDLKNELSIETLFKIESWIKAIEKSVDVDKKYTMKLLKDIFIMYEVKIKLMNKIFKENTDSILKSYYDFRERREHKE